MANLPKEPPKIFEIFPLVAFWSNYVVRIVLEVHGCQSCLLIFHQVKQMRCYLSTQRQKHAQGKKSSKFAPTSPFNWAFLSKKLTHKPKGVGEFPHKGYKQKPPKNKASQVHTSLPTTEIISLKIWQICQNISKIS
jgi:hypothetical protein